MLPRILKSGIIGSALLAAGLLTTPLARAQFSWRIVKHEGRDYLPLENVGQFYQLQVSPRTISNPLTTLSGPRAKLELAGTGRELIVNGLRVCLS